MKEDNWEGRAAKMTCDGCMWYVAKKGTIGRCRRHCPTMNGYPVVFVSDWCGDYKMDENKYTEVA